MFTAFYLQAFSGFYYTTTFLNISDVDSATEFSSSIQNYCSKPWEEVSYGRV